MEVKDIAYVRLANQSLAEKRFTKPYDVVSWFGAVQSQDYPAAKWSLGLRIQNAADEDIEKAYNDGVILRTHVMRPTWHFVLPEDIRWMLTLTASRVKSLMAHYDRNLELTEELLSQTRTVISKALEGNKYLTRKELAEHLENSSIPARGQRLGHIVAYAELDGIICSGPRRGKQFTYALLDERVPSYQKMNGEESRAKLALKYFTSHGPAQLKDFTWWSGLSVKDAESGLESVKAKLTQETLDGKKYYFFPDSHAVKQKPDEAFLLSIFDEYTIAYKDRSALGGEKSLESLLSQGSTFTSVLILGGKTAGTWKRIIKKETIDISVHPFRNLLPTEKESLESAVRDYGKFHGREAVLFL